MRLLDIDPLTGAVETFEYDAVAGHSIVTRTEDVDHILDLNQASYNEGKGKSASWRGDDNDFWFVGRIPLTLLQSWLDEFNAARPGQDKLYSFLIENEEWERFMYGRWNSSEYRKLKTAPVNF